MRKLMRSKELWDESRASRADFSDTDCVANEMLQKPQAGGVDRRCGWTAEVFALVGGIDWLARSRLGDDFGGALVE